MATRTGTTEKRVNPSSNLEVDCPTESNLPENTSITYSWTRDGVVMDGEETMAIVVSQTDANETMSEIITCTARTTDPKLASRDT